MKGLSPADEARHQVATAMFRIKRDFPSLRAQDAVGLLVEACINELAGMGRITPVEMAYRIADGLVAINKDTGEPA